MDQANDIFPIDSQGESGWLDARKTSESAFLCERTVVVYGVEEATTNNGVRKADHDISKAKLPICDPLGDGEPLKLRY